MRGWNSLFTISSSCHADGGRRANHLQCADTLEYPISEAENETKRNTTDTTYLPSCPELDGLWIAVRASTLAG